MGWTEALQKAIEFMETHITEPITIEEIAREAGVSVLTDITVADYLRKRRLTLAAQELANTKDRIIDVAFKYGYKTLQSFAKAFRRQHPLFNSYNRLLIRVQIKGAKPMNYKIVEKNSFQVTGQKRAFSMMNNETIEGIPAMWKEINEGGTTDRLLKLSDGEVSGILGICIKQEEESRIDYWIAVSYEGSASEEFETIGIPAAKWVVFEVHGPMPNAMQQMWKQIYAEWFPSNSYKQAQGIPEFERYPEEDPYQDDSYSEIWIPIKS
ncbi:AraC family transcriptional regulator [Domibacillus robiginosus]|uniref:AraC family transcriptional regulator n=1 Tax=Domibacillus robiginosus TaxID=1071054 RepID=UPI00067DCB29|nr:AraC family transcriptional regulator [Domibacillus robiginosus]